MPMVTFSGTYYTNYILKQGEASPPFLDVNEYDCVFNITHRQRVICSCWCPGIHSLCTAHRRASLFLCNLEVKQQDGKQEGSKTETRELLGVMICPDETRCY